MQRARARAEGQGVGRDDLARKVGFKGVDVRAQGRSPAAIVLLLDVLPFIFCDSSLLQDSGQQ